MVLPISLSEQKIQLLQTPSCKCKGDCPREDVHAAKLVLPAVSFVNALT